MKINNFYVIILDFNSQKFVHYDVIPYLKSCYDKAEKKPKTFDEFKEFIKSESMYMWWARCQYEIMLTGWIDQGTSEKWDVHRQVMMNLDTIANILYEIVQ